MFLVLGATNTSTATCNEPARAIYEAIVELRKDVWFDERCAAPDAFDRRDFGLATRAHRRRHLFEDPGSEIRTFRTVALRAITRCEQSR
jgi:hypothetical protein